MPLRNRVDPLGEIHAVPNRGSLMGNRGILHDSNRALCRTHAHKHWVTCRLRFRDRAPRALMAPRHYTELFFLDEATAFAAGHRPCGECQNRRYRAFVAAWCRVHGPPDQGRQPAQAIDLALHAARITRTGTKITYRAALADLPDGTMFESRGMPFLVWNGQHLGWSFDGYRQAVGPEGGPGSGTVSVLTPKPVVEVFAAGWRPGVGC